MQRKPKNSILKSNNLWIARKRTGLPQKKVAVLLGNRSLSTVSEYERGRKLPSLRAAVKLELLYRTPLQDLFPDLYREAAGALPLTSQTRPQICES